MGTRRAKNPRPRILVAGEGCLDCQRARFEAVWGADRLQTAPAGTLFGVEVVCGRGHAMNLAYELYGFGTRLWRGQSGVSDGLYPIYGARDPRERWMFYLERARAS